MSTHPDFLLDDEEVGDLPLETLDNIETMFRHVQKAKQLHPELVNEYHNIVQRNRKTFNKNTRLPSTTNTPINHVYTPRLPIVTGKQIGRAHV